MPPIPLFDHNDVIPPHLGDPRNPSEVSPYVCTTLELCERFAYSPRRREILQGYLGFRNQLNNFNIVGGVQWIDGSFIENIESLESRSPNDIDVITIFSGLIGIDTELVNREFPHFRDPRLSKKDFYVDHYPFDAAHSPFYTVDQTKYWIQLFTHNRLGVWKGILQVPLNTPELDEQALEYLKSL